MKYKDRVKKDFDLNIDSQKEFEIFNNKIELVDDSVSLMHDFTKFKRSMVLTCSVLGALLVGSIGVNVVGFVFNDFRGDSCILMSNSLDAANEYFQSNNNVYIHQISHFMNNDIVFNVFVGDSYFGQIYSRFETEGYSFKYSMDNADKTIVLSETNTIWDFGNIKDKNVDITFYKNDLIVDTFSFKI